MIAQLIERTDVDVAEDLYMPEEKTNAVLRAEIDRLDKSLGAAIIEVKELNAKVDANHRDHNNKHHSVDRRLVVLLGDGDLGDGLVRRHKSALARVWERFEKQDSKIEEGKENTWKLKLALVVAAMSTGGGVVYTIMRFLA